MVPQGRAIVRFTLSLESYTTALHQHTNTTINIHIHPPHKPPYPKHHDSTSTTHNNYYFIQQLHSTPSFPLLDLATHATRTAPQNKRRQRQHSRRSHSRHGALKHHHSHLQGHLPCWNINHRCHVHWSS